MAMNPERSSLTGKLILLVLCLILACLVILVGQSYRKSGDKAEAFNSADLRATSGLTDTEAASSTGNRAPASPGARSNGIRFTPKVEPSPSFSDAASDVISAPGFVEQNIPRNTTILSAVHVSSEVAGPVTVYSNAPAIVGRVTLVGTPPPEIPIQMSPTCGQINPARVTTRHYVVGPNGGLANVLVWIKDAPAIRISGGDPTPALDQVGCMFQPYVLGVLVNQPFVIRNSDPELHNVHATPKRNREFNIGQPQRGKAIERSFSNPELFVRLKCDVHPWMFAYVNVLEHPFYAITGTNGFFRIPAGLSEGEYTLGVAHLKTGERNQKIRIEHGQQLSLDLRLDVPVPSEVRRGVVSAPAR